MMTGHEFAAAVRRAGALCDAEVRAATEEYDEGRRKIAAVRKERSTAARAQRDKQVADLKAQLAREREEARRENNGGQE
jgi:hypothetical protein